MEQYLYDHPEKHYTFDFSKKRVKENGSVMSKFDMGYTLEHTGDHWRGLSITCHEEIWSYEEVKTALLEHLEKKQFSNVTIIK
jgi:hypothetical protein